MTLIRKHLLFGAAVVAIVALFAATDVPAQEGFPLDGNPIVRDCTDDGVRVTSGPDGNGGLADVFPEVIEDDRCPGGPPCLAWPYKWVAVDCTEGLESPDDCLELKFRIHEVHVSAATDIKILGCFPDCHIKDDEPNPAAAERFISFNTPYGVRDFVGTIYTPIGIGPGPMSAKYSARTATKGKKEFRKGDCNTAGADQVGQGTALPTTLSVFETVVVNEAGDTCEIERKVDLLGCQIGQEISLDNCPAGELTTETLSVREGGTTTDASSIGCDLVISQAGSFRYCWPNGSGGMSCITF
jgi:hypothetical protein